MVDMNAENLSGELQARCSGSLSHLEPCQRQLAASGRPPHLGIEPVRKSVPPLPQSPADAVTGASLAYLALATAALSAAARGCGC